MLLDTNVPVHYMFTRIRADVLRVLLISVLFQGLKWAFAEQLPPIPLPLPMLLGTCISLLLAFNLNQSYERWWEARKLWGAIVNDSRALVRQVSSFVPDEALQRDAPESLLRALAYRQIAWCYSLGQALRGQDAAQGLDAYLSAGELAFVQAQAHKPLALLALHTAQLKALYQQQLLTPLQQVQLDATLVRLGEAMGGAERIKSTVFPASYRQLVYFIIYLFLATLSLGLVETIGLWETPVVLTVATTFFLLERTARYLQDPFHNKPTDTPVTTIARTVEANLKQLLQEAAALPPAPAESFYRM